MRTTFYAVIAALLIGCATKPDPIDRLISKLSADTGEFSYWRNGIFSHLDLPQTASPKEVVKRLLEMGLPYGQVAQYKILKIRQVHIPPIEEGSDLYTAVIIREGSVDKIVLLRYLGPAVGWWTRIYDVKPPA